jgi:hypothetical protein
MICAIVIVNKISCVFIVAEIYYVKEGNHDNKNKPIE